MQLGGTTLVPGPLYHAGPFITAWQSLLCGRRIVVLERFVNTFGQSPPAGATLPPGDPNAQASGGSEARGTSAGWWGVEPGNFRFGIAYVGDWGWIEADLVIQWRLRTPDFDIDLTEGRFLPSFLSTQIRSLQSNHLRTVRFTC